MSDLEQPRTPTGRWLLDYAGGDLDRDVFRRKIVAIEREAAALPASQDASPLVACPRCGRFSSHDHDPA